MNEDHHWIERFRDKFKIKQTFQNKTHVQQHTLALALSSLYLFFPPLCDLCISLQTSLIQSYIIELYRIFVGPF